MLVRRSDYAFAYKVGNPVKYGSAGDCYSKSKEDCRKGYFKINLNGTNMRIAGPHKWLATGYPVGMSERISQFEHSDDWKVVSAHCGGSCSQCEPHDGHIRLQPDMCLDNSNQKKPPPVKKKETKRRKRSTKSIIWSWWPW